MSKYGPFTISTRERSRLAWRQRVDAAARAYHLARMAWRARVRDGKFGTFKWQAFKELADALSAPRPWRSQRKPDPRRRYSRSHRRACQRCRVAGYGWRRGQVSGCSCEITADYGWGARVVCVDLRDPHGRRER